MKRLTLAALAGAATVVSGTTANAVTFTYTGNIDSYTVRTGGYYEVDAWGAQGGSYIFTDLGGLGAMVGGRIYLDAGQTLSIVVGGSGKDINSNTGGGGGGASWVYVSSDLDLLLAAGGGGGAGYLLLGAGGPGLTGQNGGGSGGGVDGLGGATGGNSRSGVAGGGAGWLGPGASGGPAGVYGTGGLSGPSFQGGWTHGCTGVPVNLDCAEGQSGGFGGGGGASYSQGGGGGGYSGGGGNYGSGAGSGGGGSYISPEFASFVAESGVRAVPVIPGLEVPSPGLVTIDSMPVPEPETWAMILVGFFGLGAALRSRSSRCASSVC